MPLHMITTGSTALHILVFWLDKDLLLTTEAIVKLLLRGGGQSRLRKTSLGGHPFINWLTGLTTWIKKLLLHCKGFYYWNLPGRTAMSKTMMDTTALHFISMKSSMTGITMPRVLEGIVKLLLNGGANASLQKTRTDGLPCMNWPRGSTAAKQIKGWFFHSFSFCWSRLLLLVVGWRWVTMPEK